jgi:hypothetical protein
MQFFHLAPCPTARAAGPILIRLITESERIPRMQIETVLDDGKRMFASSIESYRREKASAASEECLFAPIHPILSYH